MEKKIKMQIKFFKCENDYYLKVADLTAIVRDRLVNLPVFKDKKIKFDTSNFSRLIAIKTHYLQHEKNGLRVMRNSKPPARTFILVNDLLKYDGEYFSKNKKIYTTNEVLNVILAVLKEAQDEVGANKEKFIKECDAHIKAYENTLFIDNPFKKMEKVKLEADERPHLAVLDREFDKSIGNVIKDIDNRLKKLEKLGELLSENLKLLSDNIENQNQKKKFLGLF